VTRFEGLSLPELMELLHEVVLPEPISILPRTQGWLVLAAWLGACLLIGLWHWRRHRRRNRYRRDAEALLESIAAGIDEAPQAAGAEIPALLKRTAIAAYPRDRVASLYGADWAAFLRTSSAGDAKVTAVAERIAQAAYRADPDPRDLVEPARRWIRVHRA